MRRRQVPREGCLSTVAQPTRPFSLTEARGGAVGEKGECGSNATNALKEMWLVT